MLLAIQAPGRGSGDVVRPFLHHVSRAQPAARRAIKLKAPRPLPRVLAVAEAQAILDACNHLRDRLLLAVLLDTGSGSARLWACGMRTSPSPAAWCTWPEGQRERHAGQGRRAGPSRRRAADAAVCRLPEPRVRRCDSDYVSSTCGRARRPPVGLPGGYDLVLRLRDGPGSSSSPTGIATPTRPGCCAGAPGWRA